MKCGADLASNMEQERSTYQQEKIEYDHGSDECDDEDCLPDLRRNPSLSMFSGQNSQEKLQTKFSAKSICPILRS